MIFLQFLHRLLWIYVLENRVTDAKTAKNLIAENIYSPENYFSGQYFLDPYDCIQKLLTRPASSPSVDFTFAKRRVYMTVVDTKVYTQKNQSSCPVLDIALL
jgi:hypothetical protein